MMSDSSSPPAGHSAAAGAFTEITIAVPYLLN